MKLKMKMMTGLVQRFNYIFWLSGITIIIVYSLFIYYLVSILGLNMDLYLLEYSD